MNHSLKKYFLDLAAGQRRENFEFLEVKNSETEYEKNYFCPNLSLVKEARKCPNHLVRRERIIEDEFY